MPVPLVGDVVAGGGDAAGLGVAEVDAAHLAVDGQRGLAGQRAQHLVEVERGVQRAGGADERLVLAWRARRRAARPPAGRARRRPGRRARARARSRRRRARRRVRKIGDRDVADLAAPARSGRTAPRRRRSARRGPAAGRRSRGRRRRGTATPVVDHAGGARRRGRRATACSRRSSTPSGAITCASPTPRALADLEQQHLVDLRAPRRALRSAPSERPRRAGAWAAAAREPLQPGAASRPGAVGGGGCGERERGASRERRGPSRSTGSTARYRPPRERALMRLTVPGPAAQQAPGFCEQKSSNWSASEPGSGVASAVGDVLVRSRRAAARVGGAGVGAGRAAGAGVGRVAARRAGLGVGRRAARRRAWRWASASASRPRRRSRRRVRAVRRPARSCRSGSAPWRAGRGPPRRRCRCRRSRRRRARAGLS